MIFYLVAIMKRNDASHSIAAVALSPPSSATAPAFNSSATPDTAAAVVVDLFQDQECV